MKGNNLTIAIGNQKGGVGKTTSTACIGAALALQGRRVLLIDLDAQQNLTFTLTQNEDPETSIYDTLVKDQPLSIVPIRENLDLVPASLDLARAEIDMATMMAREGILKSYLDEQKEKYDYILMDCSPSKGNNLTIAIGNQKGGVGKTTSTACIGAALALQGRRVLLIDLDAQQNLTFTLTQNEDPETSIYDTLVKDQPLSIVPIRENLDLVPASLDLARAEIDMATMMAREGILKSYLDEQKEKYDYILMDCSPSLGIVTTNALVAADKLYIPLTAEALPLKGLTMLDDIVREVKRRVNSTLELGGVFFTRFNNRKLNKEVISMVEKRYGEKVFQTKIRENIAIAEMPLSGQTIFEYDPKSNGAADYRTLTDEIISREENR